MRVIYFLLHFFWKQAKPEIQGLQFLEQQLGRVGDIGRINACRRLANGTQDFGGEQRPEQLRLFLGNAAGHHIAALPTDLDAKLVGVFPETIIDKRGDTMCLAGIHLHFAKLETSSP